VSDLAEIGRVSIGVNEYGLTERQAKRLRGESADEVRADAKQMRRELGLDDDEHDDRQRDGQGRYAGTSMNRIIRRASGRT
jgi:hypothetical protein